LEVKSMKTIVCETEERCEKIENYFEAIDRRLHVAMQSLTDIENHLEMQQRFSSIHNTRGKLPLT